MAAFCQPVLIYPASGGLATNTDQVLRDVCVDVLHVKRSIEIALLQ